MYVTTSLGDCSTLIELFDDLSRGEAVLNIADFSRLTSGHMGEDILDGPAVGEGALPLLPVPPGALVGVEE